MQTLRLVFESTDYTNGNNACICINQFLGVFFSFHLDESDTLLIEISEMQVLAPANERNIGSACPRLPSIPVDPSRPMLVAAYQQHFMTNIIYLWFLYFHLYDKNAC